MRSLALKGGALIGHGGYGCVFSPAIVTKKDTLITQENRHQFVSKISKNPDNEFSKTNLITKKLQSASIDPHSRNSPGWFPLEMHCFHIDTLLDVKKFLPEKDLRKANKHCEKIINRIFDKKTKNQTICITQSQKYDTTLNELLYTSWADEKIYLHDQSYKKLNILHNLGIYHLDIKGANMALVKAENFHNIYFTDWDLAVCVPDGLDEIARNKAYLVALLQVLEFKNYYFRVLTEYLYINNNVSVSQSDLIFKSIFADDVLRTFGDPRTINEKKKMLSKVDKLLFMSMWHELYNDLTYLNIIDILNNPHKTPRRAYRNALTLPLPKSPSSLPRLPESLAVSSTSRRSSPALHKSAH